MVADQQAKSEIKNFGEVQYLQSPPGWRVKQQDAGEMNPRACWYFYPIEVDAVTINVFFRGTPINQTSAAVLKKILHENTAAKSPVGLSVEEIVELSQVFGRNTVGDNQYTNEAAKGTYDYHVFHMASAQVASLQGRPVLKVRGTFQDEHGSPTSEYCGYLFPSLTDNSRVEEIFLQAPSKELFDRYFSAFEDSLHTLQWRPPETRASNVPDEEY